jgi:hypothetical protein
MIFIIENKSLAHVIIESAGKVLLIADVHPDEVAKLIKNSEKIKALPSTVKADASAISYEDDFTVYAFSDAVADHEEKKADAPAKKAVAEKAPGKKAAKAKK